ncbi:HAD family hydrolase [Candidatus Dependentiae bacterium]|nr:MAG: HAD family hydrolase [Candidatus Dependentiae bacterium]
MNFYQISSEEAIKKLKTDQISGISQIEALRRLKQYGPNTLPEKPTESWLTIFLRQFKSPLVYILLLAAAIIFIVGEDKSDTFIISGILFFNAIIGAIQEGRTRRIIERLKHLITAECIVIRDGKKQLINNADLVVGDIVLLQEGERVPADVRILSATNLCIDESALTGESICVPKNAEIIEKEVPLADRHNMAYKGTYILMGIGKAIVVATGKQTQIGTIQRAIEELEGILPLRRELNRLSKWILIFVFFACLFLFFIGLLTDKPIRELLVILTALFICVIPEGLPVVLTLVLVTGVYRMARRRILVKNMQAVEALGRTDVIVIDKTGTLTRNEMIVVEIFSDSTVLNVTGEGYHPKGELLRENKKIEHIDPHSNLMHLAEASILLNRSEISYSDETGLFTIKGDPTEAALFVLGQKIGLSKENLEQKYTNVYEVPFESRLKYHAGFYTYDKKGVFFVIGAPEFIISSATSGKEKAKEQLEHFLEKGLRVIGIGMKEVDLSTFPSPEQEESERLAKFKELVERGGLHFLGLCGIQDSIRPEVGPIIEQARAAGLEIIMATGDHKQTALYVARNVGIVRPGDEVLNGTDLNRLSDQDLMKRLSKITVYARVSPDNKLRIIKLFHQRGNIVAMTGDGINDVPSMVVADLGIAMGQIGTDVAKEAADIILLDDSFVHIISAIEQGRHIFYTIRRVILYFFATNMGEILIILFALGVSIFTPFPLPITAAQILWLNFVTDGFLDIALSTEPIEKGILAKQWLKRKLRIIDKDMLLKMIYMAIPMAIGSLWLFSRYYQTNLAYARTMTLITMAMFQWFNAWNCRSEERSIFRLGWFTNRWLIVATLFVLLLQFAVVELPIMQRIFKTVPLRASDWLLIFILSSTIIILEELRKMIVSIWFTKQQFDAQNKKV